MSFGENIAPLVGRCLMAALFVLSGIQQVEHWNDAARLMEAHGMSGIGPLLALAIVVQIGCGLALAIGFRTRLMALVLFLFVLIVSFSLHDFWTIKDAALAQTEMQLFAKNVAIAGGLLVLVGLGAGNWSYDSWRGEAD
jgi:putative oxidoreductase